MSDPSLQGHSSMDAESSGESPAKQYVVVARRYRPQTFEELIGQEHIAKALSNAITTARVGHAYLFTGARGVGKTSAARILAKSLNCERGPAPIPCNACELCESITSGDDVDVLEIDGASNRGIDEIRQLRQNVNVRPSRARSKIYIIDEVHMLTREAFNALLKTLEEPPEHVKFIFCTTEPTKIPITILSRCQRFDFAGIQTESIARRLDQIATAEGVEAAPEALDVLARRAAGSMRDSQSLLEQLLAFSTGRITLESVHDMLGTAGDQRLADIVSHLLNRDAAAALADLGKAAGEGVDVALLLEQLFGYFRDCMAAAVGCASESFLYASPAAKEQVSQVGNQMGINTILAAMQILDHALSRVRLSTQGRILAELALVQICQLEDLDDLPGLIAAIKTGVLPSGTPAVQTAGSGKPPSSEASDSSRARVAQAAASDPGKKKIEAPTPGRGVANPESSSRAALGLNSQNAMQVWTSAVERVPGMVGEHAGNCDRVELIDASHLAVIFKSLYALSKSYCERPEQISRLQQALVEVAGQPIRVSFRVEAAESSETPRPAEVVRSVPRHQRLAEIAEHPLVQRAGELFGAEPLRVDDPPDRK